MDLCTIFAHKVKIGCTLDEKQMEMQTLNKKADATREKDIYRVTVVGSVVNFLLLVFKFFAGIVGHSAAMLADAVHSLSDFITDIIVIVFVRISAKPEDEGHDYGHGKYETLATAIIGIFLLFVGFGIFWNGASSIYRFLQGGSLQEPGILALVAALVSIVFKEVLYQYTVFKGRKLNSQAVVANAWHHRSDAFSSIGTAAGIGGAILLGDHWRVLDPVAAVIVSFFIMKVAVQLLIPCVDELLEKSLPAEVEDEILKTILSFSRYQLAASPSYAPHRQLLCHRGACAYGWQHLAGGSSRDGNGGGEQAEKAVRQRNTGQHPCGAGEEE